MKDLITLSNMAKAAPTIIATCAFCISIYMMYRDRLNRQFDMLHKIVSNISDLNRRIAETMLQKGKKELKDAQRQVFLTELKNQYEFLAFLINRKQIRSKHILDLEYKFIKKFAKDTGIENDNYPEIHTLLSNLRKK